jgi:hypothetical protein
MFDPVDRAVHAIARRNSFALVWAQFGVAHLIVLAGMGLLRLDQPMSQMSSKPVTRAASASASASA